MPSNRDSFGRHATKPSGIPLRGWWQVLKRVWQRTGRDAISILAAGCAFFAMFALVPALSALISLYALLADPATVQQQFAAVSGLLPGDVHNILLEQTTRIVSRSNTVLGWSFALSLALAFWSANKATKSLFAALNVAYEEDERRNFFWLNAVALAFTIAGIGAVVLAMAALVYVPIFFAFVDASSLVELTVRILRWPLLALLLIIGLALLFRFGPSRRSAQWQWVSIGSLFSAAAWLLISAGFSVYVDNFGNYDATYGSLGAVVVLLFWLYLTFLIVLLGAELNAALELQTSRDTTAGEPKPMGQRGAHVADHVAGEATEETRAARPVESATRGA